VAATALMILFARSRGRISRGEGVALLLGYAAYIGWLAWTA
jgi:cation:H+ antiporter